MKPKHQAAASAVGVLAIGFALTGSGAAQAHPDRANYVPSITIVSGTNCQGVITIGWNLQKFDPQSRAWGYFSQPGDPGQQAPRMTLQGLWHGSWWDLVDEGPGGSENHIRYVHGKAVTAFRLRARADNVASGPWPLEALADC